MKVFRQNNVLYRRQQRIDSEKPDTLEFAPFINIMLEWYARDISKKVKTGIRTKGTSGKPIATKHSRRISDGLTAQNAAAPTQGAETAARGKT